jgi:hypothetical protein
MKPTYHRRKPAKWCRSFETRRLTVELSNHINGQCITFGITINWNYHPSIEIDFLFWRLYVAYVISTKKDPTHDHTE